MAIRAEVLYSKSIKHAQRIVVEETKIPPRANEEFIEVILMYERIRVSTLKGCEQVLDIYYVDKYGNVYGANGIELKQTKNSSGYLQVSLKVKDKRRYKKCFVHRLVALAFVEGMTDKYNEVDHKDTNKLNNKWYNLRWTDRKGNMQNELTKDKMKGINGKQCYVYDYMLNYIGCFQSITDACIEIGEEIKGINVRTKTHYILEKPDLSIVLKINRKQKIQSVVITDIITHEKFYFYSNREARRFFDNKVNITQAIQKNWTVKGRFKVRNLNYKKLICMLDL